MDTETIIKTIQATEQERDRIVSEANQSIAFLNGKIAALRELLELLQPQPAVADPE